MAIWQLLVALSYFFGLCFSAVEIIIWLHGDFDRIDGYCGRVREVCIRL